MWRDPIVEQVRSVREEYAAKFNFDIKAIGEDARRRQAMSKRRVVSFADATEKDSLRDHARAATIDGGR